MFRRHSTWGARIVLLDSKDDTGSHGSLDQGRLEWLDERLTEAANKPTIVAIHHPPHEMHQAMFSGLGLTDAAVFVETIKRYGNVKHLLCGHFHLAVTGTIEGIPFTASRGTSYQVEVGFERESPANVYADRPSYDVLCLDIDNVVVHCQVGPDFDALGWL